MEEKESNNNIIIDNGSGYVKAGFSNEKEPKVIIPNQIGYPKIKDENKDFIEFYCGEEIKAEELKGKLNISSPIVRGDVKNWDDLERIWGHITVKLNIAPEEHNFVLTEPIINIGKNKEKMAQTMFETFNIPGLYIQNVGVLSLYANGLYQGISVDSGDEVTQFVPIFEGYVIPNSVNRIDFGGKDLTEYMVRLLIGKNIPIAKEKEIAKDIKEKACYVAYNFEDEMKSVEPFDYELPDGSSISIDAQRIKCPEAIFDPYLAGRDYDSLAKICNNSIQKCDDSLYKDLYHNIILSGGNTMFNDLKERFSKEVKALAPLYLQEEVKIISESERKYAAWIGGTVLSSMENFEDLCIKKDEYEEEGPKIVHKKFG